MWIACNRRNIRTGTGWAGRATECSSGREKIRDSFTGDTHPILPSRTKSGRHGVGNANNGRSATATAGAGDQHVPSYRTLSTILGAVGAKPRHRQNERDPCDGGDGASVQGGWTTDRGGNRGDARCPRTRGGGGIDVGRHNDAARPGVRCSHARKARR